MRTSRGAGRPIRIAYVTGSLDLGGSERQMVLLARHLPRDRFEVEFVLLGRPGILADEARAAGARVHALHGPSRAGVSPAIWVARALRSVVGFIRLVRRRRYDVLDAWLFGSYALAAVTRPLTRVPVLVSGRRSLSDYKAGFWFAQRLADWLASRWSNAIVANADAVADDVSRREGLPRDRIRVIRNAVEPVPSPGHEALLAMRHEWGAQPDDVVIGSVANYKRGKGIEMLIDAYADVAAQQVATRLVLVGEGSLRAELEERIRAHGLGDLVVLAGSIPDPRPVYHAFDISVLASESEGLPNVLLEAAVAERPLLATDAGASREVVVDGETGLLVPIGDRAAMVRALLTLVRDPELRSRMGSAARHRAISEFGVERCVTSFAAMYEDLVVGRDALGTR